MQLAEIMGAALGLVGTVLLATRGRWAGWGFAIYLASNAAWLLFAYDLAHWGLFVQQIGFTITSLIGIWTWIVRPALRRRENGAEWLAARNKRAAVLVDHELWKDGRALDQRSGEAPRDVKVVSRECLRSIYLQGEEQGRALEREGKGTPC
ncbi:nicotinamide mononucleotide transporter [Acidovorax sp. BLS4]|uniref:nicotinamide mononucleotide transporter n=1 Tax=Acidovorax sp. BLS4 TaxID=3273430 RepID=UPI0029426F4E|nr:nicotinamide mononucleotide transporter [Paracidovorax avenae]WOI45882.1 nicotinamide mononucleotide transporter [Paracidovorax avenae]